MSTALPPELEAFVGNELAAGRYPSKEALVCDAVRVLQDLQIRRAELQRHVQQGIDQLDRGEGTSLEDEQALQTYFDDIVSRGQQRLAVQHARQ